MTLPLNLCTGNKKNAKCLNAKLEIATENRPIWAGSSATHKVTCLTIFCIIKQRIQIKYVVECPHYANQTLTEATRQ
jgi:hypothetical protein